jgi:predicted transcriptional regulator
MWELIWGIDLFVCCVKKVRGNMKQRKHIEQQSFVYHIRTRKVRRAVFILVDILLSE